MSKFTGERVIPGQVNEDLWAEHVARYAFARHFTPDKRVLDVGCGAGYGTSELAEQARLAVGIDLATEAVAYASMYFPNASFLFGSATALPFTASSFDVATAFEVIEHLTDWSSMLAEVRRVLRPAGLLIVSTPNRLYYAEARGSSGPNPYHQREFEFAEFRAALQAVFPYVEILLQDRLEAFAFHPQVPASRADGYLARSSVDPTQSAFFVGICSRAPIPDAHPYVYVPNASNLLGEREKHIRLLQNELAQVRHWLQETISDRDELLGKHGEIEGYLEERNRWALQLEANWRAAQARVVELQEDFKAQQELAMSALASLTEEDLRKTRWALDTSEKLQETVRQLEETQAMLADRTEHAGHLDAELRQITEHIEMMRRSRWLKLGRLVGLGPDLGQAGPPNNGFPIILPRP